MKKFLQMILLGGGLFGLFGVAPLKAADWQDQVGQEQVRLLAEYQNDPAQFYVSPQGDDAWSGRLPEANAEKTDGPFLTLARAQKAVREERQRGDFTGGPIVVQLEKGRFDLDVPLVLTAEDSGTAESPVIWRGTGNETILNAGRFLKDPQPIADKSVYERLKPEVRDKIVQFDMKAVGISDFGDAQTETAQLYVDDALMRTARYPNEGFLAIPKLVAEGTTPLKIHGIDGIQEGLFYFDDDEFLKWGEEKDFYAFGYWFWDWSTTREKVLRIDPEKKIIETTWSPDDYGFRAGQYYYVYNLLAELDAPGEFYIDREKGILYFYPPQEYRENSILFTFLPRIFELQDVSHVVLAGCLLEGCRKAAIQMSGDSNMICQCCLKNMDEGIQAVGTRHLIFGNHLYNLASGGITLASGDVATLTHGQSAAVNNDIHHYGLINRVYKAGIAPSGCGYYIANNRITDAPHCAILFSGCENIFEYNEVANVCFESNDAGAIYCGRNWSERGNRIRGNYLHDISGYQNKGCDGVYLDDQFSGAEISGNLFVNVTNAAFIGGGREDSISNNLFIECHPPIHVDARGLNWQKGASDHWAQELKDQGTHQGRKVTESPYREKYPEIMAVLDGQPGAPENCVIDRNVIITKDWVSAPALYRTSDGEDGVYDEARPYLKIEKNILGDYRLLSALTGPENSVSPILRAIDFKPLSLEKMGIFDHPAATNRNK